jgi:3-oxoacyl-[acyl-carrier-protein] synthase-1/3-oxoacyl-[acyl-carrier-protein] synthase II
MESLFKERRHPAPPSSFETAHAIRYPVFEVPEGFFPSEFPEDGQLLRTSRLALAAALEALHDADWNPENLRGLRVGVCIGTTVGSAMNSEEFYRDYRSGKRPEMTPIERFLRSNPAASVARHFGLSGPVQTVVNACSSGTDALGLAASWVRNGLCDVALAGGADELTRVTYNGFASLMIADAKPVRPFDLNRRGLNLGEGAGMLVLESEKTQQARKAKIRSHLLGYGSACDAYHLTAPSPEGLGLRRALDEAMNTADCRPEDIAFVNAHGTGTPDNDRVESQVLDKVLPRTPFLSTKGFTGHTLGAAGAIEAAFTIACMEAGRIPTSAGFAEPDPALPINPISQEVAIEGRAALSQSLAFGGNNAVVIFGKEGLQ